MRYRAEYMIYCFPCNSRVAEYYQHILDHHLVDDMEDNIFLLFCRTHKRNEIINISVKDYSHNSCSKYESYKDKKLKPNKYIDNVREAYIEYILRKNKWHGPKMLTVGSAFYPHPQETAKCCISASQPTVAFPWVYNQHCRTIIHVASLFGVSALKLKRMIKNPPSDFQSRLIFEIENVNPSWVRQQEAREEFKKRRKEYEELVKCGV